jgi:phosphate/sulfate permease
MLLGPNLRSTAVASTRAELQRTVQQAIKHKGVQRVTADRPLPLFLFLLLRLSPAQVCTACANAFAHGSNEVANAIGPLAAIYHVWQTGGVTSKNPVPTWLLAIGGVGIVFGVATSEFEALRYTKLPP